MISSDWYGDKINISSCKYGDAIFKATYVDILLCWKTYCSVFIQSSYVIKASKCPLYIVYNRIQNIWVFYAFRPITLQLLLSHLLDLWTSHQMESLLSKKTPSWITSQSTMENLVLKQVCIYFFFYSLPYVILKLPLVALFLSNISLCRYEYFCKIWPSWLGSCSVFPFTIIVLWIEYYMS